MSWGFGYPLLDAMACKTPVVASNLTSIPAFVGDAGILINPNDWDSIVEGIKMVLNKKDLEKTWLKKGQKKLEITLTIFP